MNLSPDVIEFLNGLLAQVTLSVGADDFEDTAQVVVKAKRELADAAKPKPA